jgi:hypothetical protein
VLPNTFVEPTPTDHFTEDERRGRLVPDRHPDEHATCYMVQGRGLVVKAPTTAAKRRRSSSTESRPTNGAFWLGPGTHAFGFPA